MSRIVAALSFLAAALLAATSAGAASGRGAVNALVGNTVDSRATDTKAEVFAFFAKDGTLRTIQQEKRAAGTWAYAGTKLCLKETDASPLQCYAVDVDGDEVTFRSERQTVRARILSGNPMKL